MGKIKEVNPVKLIMGIIACTSPSRGPTFGRVPTVGSEEVIKESGTLLGKLWGEVDLSSPVIPFDFTDYYEEEMGKALLRQWLSFEKLISPEETAEIKIKTNEIEEKMGVGDRRRINLDPGYIDGAKLVLASTKNYSHRIYLNSGIYAEVTLIYEKNSFHPLAWTYSDYKTDTALKFFSEVRTKYLEQTK